MGFNFARSYNISIFVIPSFPFIYLVGIYLNLF
jgi:hypothetical protein